MLFCLLPKGILLCMHTNSWWRKAIVTNNYEMNSKKKIFFTGISFKCFRFNYFNKTNHCIWIRSIVLWQYTKGTVINFSKFFDFTGSRTKANRMFAIKIEWEKLLVFSLFPCMKHFISHSYQINGKGRFIFVCLWTLSKVFQSNHIKGNVDCFFPLFEVSL